MMGYCHHLHTCLGNKVMEQSVQLRLPVTRTKQYAQ